MIRKLTRGKLGELIYLSMYQDKGGKWEAVETKEVWYEAADRFMRLNKREMVARENYNLSRGVVAGRPTWEDLDPSDPYDYGMMKRAYEIADASTGGSNET